MNTRLEAQPAEDSERDVEQPDEPNVLDHEYDGIREYDNPLPRWWVTTFWVSFVFAGAYFFHYHVSGKGESVHVAYEAEVRAADEAEAKRVLADAVSTESLRALMQNTTTMQSASAIYVQRCQVCHAEQGKGGIGPNLTDDYFLHGASLMDIYQVIHDGVAAKGMPAWSRQLSPAELRQVVAFVGTMRGTNLAGKAPEGARAESLEN
jgi:cytochrome c oxidase cbb3-type subunit 3